VSHLVRTYLLKLVKCEFRLLFVASFFLVDSAQTSVDWRLQCTDTSANRKKFHVYVDNRMLNEDVTGPFSYPKHGERRQKTGGSQNKERWQKCEVKETQQKTATFRNTKHSHAYVIACWPNEVYSERNLNALIRRVTNLDKLEVITGILFQYFATGVAKRNSKPPRF